VLIFTFDEFGVCTTTSHLRQTLQPGWYSAAIYAAGLAAQSRFSKVSCTTRLKASAATVLSRRGMVIPHSHAENLRRQPECSQALVLESMRRERRG